MINHESFFIRIMIGNRFKPQQSEINEINEIKDELLIWTHDSELKHADVLLTQPPPPLRAGSVSSSSIWTHHINTSAEESFSPLPLLARLFLRAFYIFSKSSTGSVWWRAAGVWRDCRPCISSLTYTLWAWITHTLASENELRNTAGERPSHPHNHWYQHIINTASVQG